MTIGESASPRELRYGQYDPGADGEEIAIRVTSADFNGQSFDGNPFSASPQWLRDAVHKGTVAISREHGDRDYAVWLIKSGDAEEMTAFPGDYIIRRKGGSLSVVNAEDAFILINLRPPLAEIPENF